MASYKYSIYVCNVSKPDGTFTVQTMTVGVQTHTEGKSAVPILCVFSHYFLCAFTGLPMCTVYAFMCIHTRSHMLTDVSNAQDYIHKYFMISK